VTKTESLTQKTRIEAEIRKAGDDLKKMVDEDVNKLLQQVQQSFSDVESTLQRAEKARQ